MGAAAARAAHLEVDGSPPLFEDHLARALLGEQAEELIGRHHDVRGAAFYARLRVMMTTRSRYTEDRLGAAVARGVEQYVVLGAGLDTFAYRSDLADKLRIFEVDHPASQQWKRARLADAGIVHPTGLAFVAVDFAADSLWDHLVSAGFDPGRPAFVAWLGVTVYLTPDAVEATLRTVARFAAGTELVVGYAVPETRRDAASQRYAEVIMAVAAEYGEPWRTYYSPEEMGALLDACGFEVLEQPDGAGLVDAVLWERADGLEPLQLSGHVRARVRGD